MSWGRDDKPPVVFEAKIEATTGKAYLLTPTLGGDDVWIPKSQVVGMGEPDGDGNVVFEITAWIAGKNDIT